MFKIKGCIIFNLFTLRIPWNIFEKFQLLFVPWWVPFLEDIICRSAFFLFAFFSQFWGLLFQAWSIPPQYELAVRLLHFHGSCWHFLKFQLPSTLRLLSGRILDFACPFRASLGIEPGVELCFLIIWGWSYSFLLQPASLFLQCLLLILFLQE